MVSYIIKKSMVCEDSTVLILVVVEDGLVLKKQFDELNKIRS